MGKAPKALDLTRTRSDRSEGALPGSRRRRSRQRQRGGFVRDRRKCLCEHLGHERFPSSLPRLNRAPHPLACAHPPPPSSPSAGLPSPPRVPQRFRVPLAWPVQPHEQRRLGQQLPQRGVWHQHLQVSAALVQPRRRAETGRGQGGGLGTGQALASRCQPRGSASGTPGAHRLQERTQSEAGPRKGSAGLVPRSAWETEARLSLQWFSQVHPWAIHRWVLCPRG